MSILSGMAGKGLITVLPIPSIMRFAAECVPCLLNRVIYETDLIDPGKREEAVRGALGIIAEGYPKGENSAKLATKVHRHVYHVIGNNDPYLDLKRRSNMAALSIVPKAEEFISRSKERFEAACLISIIGNVMDFGIDVGLDGPEAFTRCFDPLLAQGIEVNDVAKLRELLAQSKRVVYLMDNSGEIVLDRFLVREIQSMGVEVVGVVKGEPILTDATMDDLRSTGMDQVFDSFITTETFAVGLDLERVPTLNRILNEADLVISKGMANFEALSDEKLPHIAYLLRAKCNPVAAAIGAKKDQNVVRVMSMD
jgi:uncharacterized protein with ATP-grasp and redox domains